MIMLINYALLRYVLENKSALNRPPGLRLSNAIYMRMLISMGKVLKNRAASIHTADRSEHQAEYTLTSTARHM